MTRSLRWAAPWPCARQLATHLCSSTTARDIDEHSYDAVCHSVAHTLSGATCTSDAVPCGRAKQQLQACVGSDQRG